MIYIVSYVALTLFVPTAANRLRSFGSAPKGPKTTKALMLKAPNAPKTTKAPTPKATKTPKAPKMPSSAI